MWIFPANYKEIKNNKVTIDIPTGNTTPSGIITTRKRAANAMETHITPALQSLELTNSEYLNAEQKETFRHFMQQ